MSPVLPEKRNKKEICLPCPPIVLTNSNSNSELASSPTENFYTPTPSPFPTPSQSTALGAIPIPSVSCQTHHSIQSFHTAIEPRASVACSLKKEITSEASYFSIPQRMSEELPSSFYPNSYFYYGSLDQASGLLSRSPGSYYLHDNYSEEYDVILDDGTRQKRSVSLSTMPFGRSITNEDDCSKKKKYKANYNHFYYDDEEESTNSNTKNHIDE
jgi:hypothetical protein